MNALHRHGRTTAVRAARGTTGRRALVVVAVAAALATSACGAGQIAGTAQQKATLDGTNVNVGDIALRGLAIVTPDAATYPAGSNPEIILVMVNDGESTDTLESISSSAATGWGTYASDAALQAAALASPSDSTSAAPSTTATAPATTGSTATTPSAPASSTSSSPSPSTPVSLPAGVAVSYGVPVADGRVLALLKTTRTLYPGTTVPITFTFAKAGSQTFPVPIRISNDTSYSPPASFLPTDSATDGG